MVANKIDEAFLDLNIAQGLSESYSVTPQGIVRNIQFNNKQTTSFFQSKPVQTSSEDLFSVWWRTFLDNESKLAPQVDFDGKHLTYIDLFSSVGGLSLGFEQACMAMGIRAVPLLAVDVDELALRVHKANHGTERTLNDSVSSMVDFKVVERNGKSVFPYEPELLGNLSQGLKGKVDAIVAGPPCQGYSTLNNHSRGDDPRNLLYLTVPAIAVAMEAKYVVIENVPNVVNSSESVVRKAIDLLANNGYKVTSGVLEAHKLGWPQTRKRFFLVASREETPLSIDTIKEQYRRSPMPVTWAISNFKVSGENENHLMNQLSESSEENIRRINWLFDNGEFDLPNHVRPDCHKDGHTYPSVYGRMHPDQPAPTLTTGFMSPGRGRFIHPLERRMLTPREAARLQGFPNWFNFVPDPALNVKKSDLGKWIGDAVPSILGYFAGLALAPALLIKEN